MATKKKALQAAAGNAGGDLLAIEDVFSTYLYTGSGSALTITNGIDLAGEGGLVWLKSRDNPLGASGHRLFDTERGVGKNLQTDDTSAEATDTDELTAFNSDGFSVGADSNVNYSAMKVASWTFRKAPRFFDCFTYSGNGTSQSISHNLGIAPAVIITRRTDFGANWLVYHTSISSQNIYLNKTDAASGTMGITSVTDTSYSVNGSSELNENGGTYVAYLYAHDPLGPSGDGSDGLIACGSFTTDGSGLFNVDLGWEPQWILAKRSDSTGDWGMLDNMRGITDSSVARVWANLANAEGVLSGNYIKLTPTGFKGEANYFGTNGQVIYIAIRRGPMRQPTSGTEVFAIDRADANGSATNPEFVAGFPVDHAILKGTGGSGSYFSTRLIAPGWGDATTTAAYTTTGSQTFDFQNGWYENSLNNTYYSWMFRRAPGFFDVVAYEGDGLSTSTFNHNLGVAPELMIIKNRDDIRDWCVYHKDLGATYLMNLNSTAAAYQSASYFPADPTETVFRPGNASATNRSGYSHIAYLFATLPGVSKVGSYVGTGAAQTIDCGFTTGARFILIKAVDAPTAENWVVFDTARGIVVGNDPSLSLNVTSAEVTGFDLVEPDASGFKVVNSYNAHNGNGINYIFLAIA